LSPLLFALYIYDLAKSCCWPRGVYIILYADDILLDHLSPSVSQLQNYCIFVNLCIRPYYKYKKIWLLTNWLTYNNVTCHCLRSLSGTLLPCTTEMRYMSIYFSSSKYVSISLRQSRRSFYRAANAIFGNVGRIATEDVVLHLLMCKCRPLPILLYGLEACPLKKTDLHSLDLLKQKRKKLINNNSNFLCRWFSLGLVEFRVICECANFCFLLPLFANKDEYKYIWV